MKNSSKEEHTTPEKRTERVIPVQANVLNGGAITETPKKRGPEEKPKLEESGPQVVNGSAIGVKEGAIITGEADNRNIVQKGLDAFTQALVSVEGWLEDSAEEMADYDYGGISSLFYEYGQGYAGRGGSFSLPKVLGCTAKAGVELCFGIPEGISQFASHPIEGVKSFFEIPKALKNGWDQYQTGNWTQKTEMTLEAVGMAILLKSVIGKKTKGTGGKAKGIGGKARGKIKSKFTGLMNKGESLAAENSKWNKLWNKLAKKLKKESKKKPKQMGGCFTAGTKVSTPKGMRRIEDILPGEEVYGENPVTGKQEIQRVIQTFQKKENIFVYLRIQEKEICCTLEHPFWHKERGWIKAGELLPGDILKQRDGQFVDVTSICQEKKVESQSVYNLEVEELHTYYVEEGEILVHNNVGAGGCAQPGKVRIESGGKVTEAGLASIRSIDSKVLKELKKMGLDKKFKNAMEKGLAPRRQGTSGIIELSKDEIIMKGGIKYTYKLKVPTAGGHTRVYGYVNDAGELVFDLLLKK